MRYIFGIYVKRKVRIRTILGFCCANLGSELWRNNPRIALANIGSEDLLRKPQIRGFAAQTSNPWICCANLKSTRNHLGSRNQTPATRGNKPTIDCASEAARPSTETKPQPIARASSSTFCGKEPRTIAQQSSSPIRGNEAQSTAQSDTPALQATMVNHRGFVATDGRAALRALSIVGLLPRMAEIWLRDPR